MATRRKEVSDAIGVRPATAQDVESVLAIERASFADPWSPSAFRSVLRSGRAMFAVAQATERISGGRFGGGDVLGYVVAWFVADEGEIANLAVAPAERGRGIGAMLLDLALEESAARGVSVVYLEVRESNAAARSLYASRGFVEFGRRRRYYRNPVEDALVLRREIT